MTYNTVGHCFFLEDGAEHGNQFVHNLAIQIKCHTSKACAPTNLAANGENMGSNSLNRATYRADSMSGKDTLLPSDNTVTAYWITNPDNVFIDNVAAGSDENGFWWSLPEHPQGKFEGTEISKATWPRRTRMAEFRGNVAHSNFDGFMLDRNINLEGVFGLAGPSHIAKENPADENSKSVESLLADLTAYKNRNGGVWSRGELHVFRNCKAADNAIGFTSSTGSFGADTFTSLVVDSLFVGETDNIGNPVTPEEKAYGRSLPKRLIPDFPIRAYEYYDYRHDVVNTTFVNFQDNKQRGSGALSWLLFTGAGVTTENTVKSAKYINAKPVYFPKIDSRFDSDNRSGSAYRTAAIHDLDGSTTGIPDSYVLIHDGENDSVATDDTCEIHPTWNASVCKGDIGRIQFSIRRAGPTSGVGLALKDVALRSAASCAGGWSCAGCWSCAGGCSSTTNYPEPQWQGLQDHGQSEHCARRYRDPCEDRKTGSFYQLDRNGQRLMGRVRAAGFRQRDLREAAGQHRRPAQGDRDFVFQGSGCRLGETGNPDRPQGHWHGSVWPVGYSNQHYGKAISTLFAN